MITDSRNNVVVCLFLLIELPALEKEMQEVNGQAILVHHRKWGPLQRWMSRTSFREHARRMGDWTICGSISEAKFEEFQRMELPNGEEFLNKEISVWLCWLCLDRPIG